MKQSTPKPKKGFMDGYKTYDTSRGHGSPSRWRQTMHERFTGEEATAILEAQTDTPEAILGIKPGASLVEIKSAFRQAMKKWHPDLNPGRLAEAEEMAKKINAAYSILSHC